MAKNLDDFLGGGESLGRDLSMGGAIKLLFTDLRKAALAVNALIAHRDKNRLALVEMKVTVNALVTLANELKVDLTADRADLSALRTAYEAHRVDAAAHTAADVTNTAGAITSTSTAAADAVSLAETTPAALNATYDMTALELAAAGLSATVAKPSL